MSDAATLNVALARAHPAAAACLSELGRRMFYPQGVPAQAAEAAGCRVDATIGQVTDGRGGVLPFPLLAARLGPASAAHSVLYAPQGGRPALRSAWLRRLTAEGLGGPEGLSLPVVTAGLTHGLSTVADLFTDADTTVLIPRPGWGNYRQIFGTRRQARVVEYEVLEGDQLAVQGLADALAAVTGKALIVLNLPSNPLGFSPSEAAAAQLAAVLAAAPGPLVVVCDDAYAGMVWEPAARRSSVFHLLRRLSPSRALVVKIDGATKELFFFGGRVGFLTFAASPEASAALEAKVVGLQRTTVSSVSSPGQAIVAAVLAAPEVDAALRAQRGVLQQRYLRMRAAVTRRGLSCWPFNSAFFTLVRSPGAPESHRLALLARGVGTVAMPTAGALRLSYGSVASEDIDALVDAVADVVG